MAKTTLVLTGFYAGRTIRFHNHQFVDGSVTVTGAPHEVEGAIRYLGRSYQAFPLDSKELAAAQERDKANGIQRDSSTSGGARDSDGIRGDGISATGKVQAFGPIQRGSDDPNSASFGASGLLPGGSGQENAGLLPEQIAKIRKALNDLDPSIDEYWTDEGLPSIEAMAQAMNDPAVNRQMVAVAWPEFNREKATELREI